LRVKNTSFLYFRSVKSDSSDKGYDSPLGKLLSELNKCKLPWENFTHNLDKLKFNNIGIYCEVALIRDAYFALKPNVNIFMDDLVLHLMNQYNIKGDCRLYSQLPEELSNCHKTHPEQIKRKAEEIFEKLTKNEQKIYGTIQALFRAKPDLLITVDDIMIVCEAKFTQSFDEEQLERTRLIASVWSKLLYKSLGFEKSPEYIVFKLGAEQYGADISWETIVDIAKTVYSDGDRSLNAFQCCNKLLKNIVYGSYP
jgi:hypothetical protein